MMQQPEVQVAADGPVVLGGRALSDQVRASLEAVREAQEAARVRARRQTVRTRIWFVAMVAAGALTALAVGPRLARGRHAAVPAAAAAPVQPSSIPAAPPEPATPAVAAPSPAAMPAMADATAAPARKPEPAAVSATELAPVAGPAKLRGAPASAEACDTGMLGKTPWLLSPEACTLAFEADPRNATLALGIAHAEYVRGHREAAAQWAQRALGLDPNTAEAYVLIARAAKATGRTDDARAAYQRYLELAPRGWHKPEARAALAK